MSPEDPFNEEQPYERHDDQSFETIPGLDAATSYVNSTLAEKLSPESLAQLQAICQDPIKAKEIARYFISRAQNVARFEWATQTAEWARDAGITRRIIDAAVKDIFDEAFTSIEQ